MEQSLLKMHYEKDSTITISKSGEIKIGDKVIDSLQILNVNNNGSTYSFGKLKFFFRRNRMCPANEDNFAISQGILEESNINPMVEMEEMIKVNNEYESAQKIIAALDTSLGDANEIGKI